MKNVKVVIICEDKAQESFVREFLRHRNFKHRNIRTLPLSNGKGAGDASVSKRFPAELKAIRTRSEALLIAVIDADKKAFNIRHNELDQECKKAQIEPRTSAERVVVAVPRRNIESWFVYLTGGAANEETDEWKRKKDDLARPAAKQLHKMCYEDQKLRQPAPQSLEEVCKEWKIANS
jgi:hypothetical protein